MEIEISNYITIHGYDKRFIEYIRKHLIFDNPEYNKKKHMGLWLGKTPKRIKLYDYYNDDLYLPLGCLDDIIDIVDDPRIYHDYRVLKGANIISNINLRDYQEPCLNALKSGLNGLFLIPCGMGKTECALACAAELKQKTLFMAHTLDLVNQAKNRCESKLSCKTSLIAEGKVDLSGDIVFGTVQTIFSKLDDIPQDTFGIVVMDEVQHVCANPSTIETFRTCFEHFASKYKLGLTATLHRADALENTILKIVGKPLYEIKEDKVDYVGYVGEEEVIRFPKNKFQVPVEINMLKSSYNVKNENEYHDVFDKNDVLVFSKLISDLANDKKRNDIIINLANTIPGSTIILSDRISQLDYLSQKISNSKKIDGNTKKDLREQVLEDVRQGKTKVLLASYKLAKEGLDCPILQNVIFATPIKDKAIVIQCIGRCQRPNENKNIARVYDIIDPQVSLLNFLANQRKKVYKEKGWY